MANRAGHRGFGNVRKRASGRYQARYTGPDGKTYTATTTFDTKKAAENWLAARQNDMAAGTWTPDSGRKAPMAATGRTFGDWAETWMRRAADRGRKPRTLDHYRRLLDRLILPTFGDVPIRSITGEQVDAWHARLGSSTPTLRAHAYSLLKTIMQAATAPQVRLIDFNPCAIPGAGNAKRVHKIKPASLAELEALVAAMPERYRVMTLIAAWCGLRFGELTELRRSDIDLTNEVIRVRRGVTHVDGRAIVGTPKSDAGIRDVAVPPHLLPAIKEHLRAHVNGRAGLLFPAADGISHLLPSTLYGKAPSKRYPAGTGYYGARAAAGRPDLRWHDLRHTGAVLAASTGATLAELMERLGHSTAGAALRYQHAAQGRDAIIAAKLSEIAGSSK